jgi:hypothetical protein
MAGPKKVQLKPDGDALDRAVEATASDVPPSIGRIRIPMTRGRSAVVLFPTDLIAAEVLLIEDHLHQALAQLTRERLARKPHLVGMGGQILQAQPPD